MKKTGQIFFAWLMLIIFPTSTYAISAQREKFLSQLQKNAIQAAVDYYNSHRKLTPKMIAQIDQQLQTPFAHDSFKGMANTLQKSILPKATINSEGKFELENGQGIFDFHELASGDFELQINQQKLVAKPDQMMEKIVNSFFIDPAQTPFLDSDNQANLPQQGTWAKRFSRIFNFFPVEAQAAGPLQSSDLLTDSATYPDEATTIVLPKAEPEKKPGFMNRVREFMTKVNRERKSLITNTQLLLVGGAAAGAASCALFPPTCLAALGIIVGGAITYYTYLSLKNSAFYKQLHRCEDENNKKMSKLYDRPIPCVKRGMASINPFSMKSWEKDLKGIVKEINKRGCRGHFTENYGKPDSICANLRHLEDCMMKSGVLDEELIKKAE